MTIIDKKDVISRHFLFRQLLPAEVDRVVELATERHFDDGQAIFRKGDDGACMMVVLAGEVVITAISEDGREIILNRIEAGGIVGEISLLDGKKRSATARAVGNCRLLSIRRGDFIPFLRTNPDVAIQMLVVLCEKLRNTSDMLEDVGLLPVPGRLARFLLRLAAPEGQNAPAPGMTLVLPLSQGKIADLVGTTRETINRTLSQWRADGIIELQKGTLTFNRPRDLLWISELN